MGSDTNNSQSMSIGLGLDIVRCVCSSHCWRVLQVSRTVLLALLLGVVVSAQGQVVINEVVAANSDRLLQRTTPGYPRLGTTKQWIEPPACKKS